MTTTDEVADTSVVPAARDRFKAHSKRAEEYAAFVARFENYTPQPTEHWLNDEPPDIRPKY